MRTAQAARPAVHARLFWPYQPVPRAPQTPANAAGKLPYVSLGCACLFLLGYLPGIWLGRTGAWEPGRQLAAYYLAKSSYSTVLAVWQWQFSAAFLQLAALYLCSFSALGCWFFLILFFLRGSFLGLCAACVLATGESRGLVCYWLLSSLPNLSVLFAGLWLAGYGAAMSNGLFQCIFSGGAARGQLASAFRRLTMRFLLCLLLAGAVSLVSAWLSFFLAGVLL